MLAMLEFLLPLVQRGVTALIWHSHSVIPHHHYSPVVFTAPVEVAGAPASAAAGKVGGA
jgi:hypothetical protein